MTYPIAYQIYSSRNFPPLEAQLPILKGFGYDAIEPWLPAYEADDGKSFRRALDAARSAGWEIVAADSAGGRIEATATTGWFGFKDDVVVRVRPAGGGRNHDVLAAGRPQDRIRDRSDHPGVLRGVRGLFVVERDGVRLDARRDTSRPRM